MTEPDKDIREENIQRNEHPTTAVSEAETILLIGLAILIAFLLWAPANISGTLGRSFSSLAYGLFGSLAVILPIFFLYLAGESHFNPKKSLTGKRKIYLTVFLIFVLVFITILSIEPDLIKQASHIKGRYSAWEAIVYSYKSPTNPELKLDQSTWSGGVIGNMTALSLIRLIGKSGSIILVAAVILALAVLIFDLSWKQALFVTAHEVSEAGKSISSWYKGKVEKRKLMEKERAEELKKIKTERIRRQTEEEAVSIMPQKPEPPAFSYEFPEGNWLKDDFNNEPSFIYTPPGGVRRHSLNLHRNEQEQVAAQMLSSEGNDLELKQPPLIRSAYIPLKEEFLLHSKDTAPVEEQSAATTISESSEPSPVKAEQVESTSDSDDNNEERLVDIASRISEGEDKLDDGTSRSEWEDRGESTKTRGGKKKVVQLDLFANYLPPPTDLLIPDEKAGDEDDKEEVRLLGAKLETTLQDFGVDAEVINFITGPTISRFEVKPGPGVKVSKIVNLSDDIALALAASSVRIEAPIPGKSAVGIEIPNKNNKVVRLRDCIEAKEFKESKKNLLAALGRNIQGEAIHCDLSSMPHLLIAGATGSGKSVCINTILISLLYRLSPKELRLVLIDPKVVELSVYNGIPHLESPVVTNPKKAYAVLEWAVKEMEERYKLFAEYSVRDFKAYNTLVEQGSVENGEHLPYIVLVVDELSDLMATTPTEVEDAIARLTSMARAAGIHLIIATQRPSVDVITGVIKANIPSRISFAVASQVDSRTIIDMGGAEKLLGKGDMLYYPQNAAKPLRGQGAFVTDAEVERVVSYLKNHYQSNYNEDLADKLDNIGKADSSRSGSASGDEEDELLYEALRTVVESEYASVSLLQRRLNVGYPRAARMVDAMHERGWVGPFEGSKPRKLTISNAEAEEIIELNS